MLRVTIATFIAGVFVALVLWIIPEDEIDPHNLDQVNHAAVVASLRPAANQGNPKAQFALAQHYLGGTGVKESPKKAAYWLKLAATKGHILAQVKLAKLYDKGGKLKEDLLRAAKWYEPAARIGRHPAAQFGLGYIYFTGEVIQKDYGEALIWFRKSANQGYAPAQYLMGGMFEEGWAVARNYIEAYKWFTLAMRNAKQVMAIDSNYDPEAARKHLVARMNNFQITRGKQRAQAWQKSP
ncbi:MAG: tetratricopeptide repeat protein [Rhodospirillales bacterium]|jgi:TPR repeat protein